MISKVNNYDGQELMVDVTESKPTHFKWKNRADRGQTVNWRSKGLKATKLPDLPR